MRMAVRVKAGTPSTLATQGRLRCTQHFGRLVTGKPDGKAAATPQYRFHPAPLDIHQSQRDAIGVRQARVSTAAGSVFHAIETRPEALTPSTHPRLGVRSKHQRLHRCAL